MPTWSALRTSARTPSTCGTAGTDACSDDAAADTASMT